MKIWEKKIILYGSSEMRADFKYLFPEVSVIGEEPCGKIGRKEDQGQEVFRVVCGNRPDGAFEAFAGEQGLRYKENYLYMKDFFRYYNPMFLERGNRKLAVWGTGGAAWELWEKLEQKGLSSEIDFYIDKEDLLPREKGSVSQGDTGKRGSVYSCSCLAVPVGNLPAAGDIWLPAAKRLYSLCCGAPGL